MTKSSHTERKPRNGHIDPAVLTAIIGGIVTIVVAVVAIVPQILTISANKPAPTVPPSTLVVVTATPVTTSPLALAPTEAPTATQIAIVPTGTPAAPSFPSLNCLNGWQIVSSDPSVQATTDSQGSCSAATIRAYGFSSIQNQLQVGLANFKTIGIFGISAPIPPNANFNIKVEQNFQDPGQNAEFWLALSNDPLPGNKVMIMAFEPQYGEMRQYVNQFGSYFRRYTWADISNNGNPSFPYDYNFHFSITGNSISMDINEVNYGTVVVNSPQYLFLGLRNRSSVNSVQMRFIISGLDSLGGN